MSARLVQGDLFDAPAADNAGVVPDLPESWRQALRAEFAQAYWGELQSFVASERAAYEVFPPAHEVFSALQLTPFPNVRVLLLGQDPYPGVHQAHGLSFSVKPGIAVPASLQNVFRELHADLGINPARHGYLAKWARQGVLLLNAVLTVRAGQPNSHKGRGWETFTDAIIQAVNAKSDPVVFVLWGAYAQKKSKLIDVRRHTIVQSAHPSPLSARNGFFGSRPFSQINAALGATGQTAIDWNVAE